MYKLQVLRGGILDIQVLYTCLKTRIECFVFCGVFHFGSKYVLTKYLKNCSHIYVCMFLVSGLLQVLCSTVFHHSSSPVFYLKTSRGDYP